MGLELAIETQNDLQLADWGASANQTKQVALHIYPVLLGGRIRKINFYDCHLLRWENSFSSTGDQPLIETLMISSAGVKDTDSAGEYSAYWRETFDQTNVEPTVIEQEEPTFIGYYFEDENGGEIAQSKLKYDQKFYLIIETESADGETITINLDDDRLDFKYNGQIAKDDTLRGITITGEETKIPLTAVKQTND